MSKRDAPRSSDREVMRHLSRSQIFKDYERAFSKAAGLPLNIRGHDSGRRHTMERGSRFTRVNSGSFQQGARRMLKGPNRRISRTELDKAHRYLVCGTLRKCSAGVVGDHILGFLETGEVMLKNPTKEHFATITRQLRAWGYKTDWKQLERAYFRTCVLSPDRYRAMLRLLRIFAQHLSILSNQLVVGREKEDPRAWRERGNS